MRLNSFLCCDRIVINPNEKPCIINPLQELKLVNVPSTYSFTLLVGISEIKADDKIVIELHNPDGGIIEIINFDFPNPPDLENKEKDTYKAMLNLDLRNVEFETLGIHTFKLYGNKELLSSFDIEIMRGDTNAN